MHAARISTVSVSLVSFVTTTSCLEMPAPIIKRDLVSISAFFFPFVDAVDKAEYKYDVDSDPERLKRKFDIRTAARPGAQLVPYWKDNTND